MKREMDRVRTILLTIQNHDKEYFDQARDFFQALDQQSPDTQWPPGAISAYIRMLKEAELVEAVLQGAQGDQEDFRGYLRLTWAGHEFIADARDPKVWEKVKSKVGDASFDLFKHVLVETVKEMLQMG